MIYRLFGILAATAAASFSPATAATTVLDFSGDICGPAANQPCENGSQIGQSYGDSATVDVTYRSIDLRTGAVAENFLKHWSGSYGDLTGVVWGGADATNYAAEIIFTAAAGFEVSLLGFDAGCYINRSTCQTLNFSIADLAGGALGGGSAPTNFPGHATVATNTAYASGLVLRWGPDSYDVGLDNIAFDVRAVGTTPPPAAVPEPASWAMMIGGFGLVGGAMRRRTRTGVTCLA